jgi:hypothetical protein
VPRIEKQGSAMIKMRGGQGYQDELLVVKIRRFL